MSEDQRLDRYRLSDAQRLARETGDRTPTPRDSLHYRGDYGTTMTDEGYGTVLENQKVYEKAVASARSRLSAARNEASNQYGQMQGDINSQNLGIPGFDSFKKDWTAKNTTPIYIYSGGNLEGTYRMTHDAASQFINTIHDTGYYSVYAFKDGHAVDVKGYGKEIHEPLGEYVDQTNKALSSAYSKSAGEANKAFEINKKSALSTLDTNYNSAMASLASSESQLQRVEADRKKQLTTIRTKYADKLKNIAGTLQSLGLK